LPLARAVAPAARAARLARADPAADLPVSFRSTSGVPRPEETSTAVHLRAGSKRSFRSNQLFSDGFSGSDGERDPPGAPRGASVGKETAPPADAIQRPADPGEGNDEAALRGGQTRKGEVSRRRRGRALALAAVGALAAASAWGWSDDPLPGNQAPWLDGRAPAPAVRHGEWALRLVEALGLASLLPGPDAEAAAFAILCPGDTAPGEAALEVAGPPAFQDVGASDAPLRLLAQVARPSLYRVRVRGRGTGRWTVEGRDVGVLDPTPLGVATSRRWVPLGSGPREIVAFATPGARVERVELVGPVPGCVAPAAGWRADAGLDFGDKARTLVQALGLEGRLPRDGAPLAVEGEDFARGGAGASRTNLPVGRPASRDAWALADGAAVELAWNVETGAPGLYSVLARVHGDGAQHWQVDRLGVALQPGPDATAFAWSEVATVPLAAGAHEIRARLPRGSGVDLVQLVRRRTDAADYLAVLAGLGLAEGAPHEPVAADAADRNLDAAPVRSLLASFRDGGPDAGARLAVVEGELGRFFTRPLSPVLPGEP
jgi:hypothetical protein